MSLRYLSVFLMLLVAISLMSATTASATMGHFYLQKESGEEFKKLTATEEAQLESNGALQFEMQPSKGATVDIGCHTEGKMKLFTNGEDELSKLKINTCVSEELNCSVEVVSFYQGPFYGGLAVEGSKYTDGLYPLGLLRLYGVSCRKAGTYHIGGGELFECTGEMENNIALEWVFPHTVKGCEDPHEYSYEDIYGRLRITPLSGGRALAVGP